MRFFDRVEVSGDAPADSGSIESKRETGYGEGRRGKVPATRVFVRDSWRTHD